MNERGLVVDAGELVRFAQLERNVIIFGRVLRGMGLGAQPDRLVLLGQALDAVGLRSRADVKDAARSVLVRSPEEAAKFDAAFDLFWSTAVAPQMPQNAPGDMLAPQPVADGQPRSEAPRFPESSAQQRRTSAFVRSDGSDAKPGDEGAAAVEGDRAFTYSFAEGLYQKEFSQLSEAEAERARELTRRQVWELGTRRSRRTQRGAGGPFDHRRTLRESLRRGGEVLSLATRTRKQVDPAMDLWMSVIEATGQPRSFA